MIGKEISEKLYDEVINDDATWQSPSTALDN